MNTVQQFRILYSRSLLLIAASVFTLFTSCSKDKKTDDPQDNETGVTIKLNGKEYHYEAFASVGNDGQVGIEFTRSNPLPIQFFGAITWKGGTGTYNWNGDSDFWWEPEGLTPARVYQHYYDDGTKISTGRITITKLDNAGGFVTGSFVIEQSGATNTESGNAEYLGASRVEGSFNVERVD